MRASEVTTASEVTQPLSDHVWATQPTSEHSKKPIV